MISQTEDNGRMCLLVQMVRVMRLLEMYALIKTSIYNNGYKIPKDMNSYVYRHCSTTDAILFN